MMRETSQTDMLIPFLRMLALLHAVMPLALSIRLRDALALMKRWRVPRTLYLPLAVTIRFVPGLVHDFRQMRDCLRLRGYRGWSVLRPRLWLLPVVFRSLHLSDELAVAAELKGIGYGRVARPAPSHNLNRHSAIVLVASLCILAGVICIYRSLPRRSPLMHTASSHHNNQEARPHGPAAQGVNNAAP
jgi:energy-coupling factor transport system permease protein